jgi:integrase
MMSILAGNATRKAHLICKELDVPINKLFNVNTDNKKLSNMTILHYHRLLGVLFHDAIRWGLMRDNPCSKVQPPKVNKVEMQCLDEGGIESLFDALSQEDIKLQTMITLLLVTGCRRGELAALQWKHIDLHKCIVSIKQAAINTPKTGTLIKTPKTRTSIRNIKIPASTVQLLKQYRTYWLEEKVKCGTLWQAEEKERLGDEWIDPEYLFTTWNGYIIFPDTISDLFRKFQTRHNLQHIRLHDLRHTAATILINAGLNVKAVSQRMGHANPNVTLAVYAHAYKTADQEAADIIGSVISKRTPATEKSVVVPK